MFISAIETGVIIVLLARFFARRERMAIQSLVYFVTFVALYVAFEPLITSQIMTVFLK